MMFESLDGASMLERVVETPASFRPRTGETVGSLLRPSTSGDDFSHSDDEEEKQGGEKTRADHEREWYVETEEYEARASRMSQSDNQERRKRRGRHHRGDCERRRDPVDFSIQQSMGKPAAWKQAAFRKVVDQFEVSLGVWEFEQNAKLYKCKYQYLSKQQLVHILEKMPVKLPYLVKETERSIHVPKRFSSLCKEELVELMGEVDHMYALLDEQERERIRKEEEERRAAMAESDEELEEELESDKDKEQDGGEAEKKTGEEGGAGLRIHFRTKDLGGTSAVVTPRQSFVMSNTFFKPKTSKK